jgi:hypothetical protein
MAKDIIFAGGFNAVGFAPVAFKDSSNRHAGFWDEGMS